MLRRRPLRALFWWFLGLQLLGTHLSEPSQGLVQWLESEGADLSNASVAMFESGMTGLRANKFHEPGDILLKIPLHACLHTLSALVSDIGADLRAFYGALKQRQSGVDCDENEDLLECNAETALLAVHLVHEYAKGSESKFHPYISQLPKELHYSSMTYSPSQLDALGPAEAGRIQLENATQRKWADEIKNMLFSHHVGMFSRDNEDVHPADLYLWALSMLGSRSWQLHLHWEEFEELARSYPEASTRVLDSLTARGTDLISPVLVPGMDMLNHVTGSGRVSNLVDDDDKFLSQFYVAAFRTYEPGDELFDSYDPHSGIPVHCNSILLQKFGFTLDESDRGCIQIQFAMEGGNTESCDFDVQMGTDDPVPSHVYTSMLSNLRERMKMTKKSAGPIDEAIRIRKELLAALVEIKQKARRRDIQSGLIIDRSLRQELRRLEHMVNKDGLEFCSRSSSTSRELLTKLCNPALGHILDHMNILRVRIGQQDALLHATKSIQMDLKALESVPDADAKLAKGVSVQARYGGEVKWFTGEVTSVNDDGSFGIRYEDGDSEWEALSYRVRREKWVAKNPLAKNDAVDAFYGDGDILYSGIISGVNDDGTYEVTYSDGEQEKAVPRKLIEGAYVPDIEKRLAEAKAKAAEEANEEMQDNTKKEEQETAADDEL